MRDKILGRGRRSDGIKDVRMRRNLESLVKRIVNAPASRHCRFTKTARIQSYLGASLDS